MTTSSGDSICARFAIRCTGYYRYDSGFMPDIPGMADFQGDIIHTQKWPADYPLKSRRVVVVGSGASACVCVRVWLCVFVCVFVFMFMFMFTFVFMCVFMFMCVFVFVFVFMCGFVCLHLYISFR